MRSAEMYPRAFGAVVTNMKVKKREQEERKAKEIKESEPLVLARDRHSERDTRSATG
jgi:hypothetical protein